MSRRRRQDRGLPRIRGLACGAALAGLAFAGGCAAPGPESAPEPASAPAPESWTVSIAPRPDDVSSIDGMVAAWYDIVSGPAGQPRDWSRDSTLYLPGVRFVIVSDDGKQAAVTDHGTFARRSNPGFEREGFHEQEIHRVTRTVGNVAYLLSTYQWRRTPDGPVGGRGVNSISLFHDGARWWITQAMWSDETPASPIPPELLPGG